MVWEAKGQGWRVPEASQRVYQKPTPAPYYNFLSYIQTRPAYISQHYSCIRFMDKVIPRDDLGDYEDEPFDVVRLYECLQD